jgi:glycosyltransferase involved in cell wall biosynthesis
MRPQPNRRAAGYADLRICVVSPFVDTRHGTERTLAELLQRLARDYGCEIHLYAQSVEDLSLSSPPSTRAAASEKSGVVVWHKVPSVPGPHVVQFLGWMFFNGFLRKWHATFGRSAYDFVLSPGINCLHPDVVIVHALFHRLKELSRDEKDDSVARAGFFRRVHRRIYYGLLTSLERRIYRNSRVTLAAVSKRTAGLLKEYFQRDDVCVIPNGVDTNQFSMDARLARRAQSRQRRGFRHKDFVLLLIGNDWQNKGLLTILEAMAALPSLSVRLLIVGNDASEPFRARAAKLRVEERCLWEFASPDVLDFYAAADVYVSPSREDSFGLPVAEAMACGLPAITSTCAGIADYVHDGIDGFVLPEPRDTRALARLVERLQADPDLRRSIGEAAARNILELDWDRNAAAVWELLKQAQKKTHRST